jgi:hypothetical protein
MQTARRSMFVAVMTAAMLPILGGRSAPFGVAGGVVSASRATQPHVIVITNARIIDGTGAAPLERGRIVIQGDRIVRLGRVEEVATPAGAEIVDVDGRTVIPGLIDLHFHIENDPRLALRQLSHGVTAFRDPGQWNEKFEELRRTIATSGLPGPRIFTTGPHIDGESPAYPADSVVARDPDEARRQAEISVRQGASALKIYFRLAFASAKAVIDVCNERRIPCTAHLELLDARELFSAGLHGVEHVTSLGISIVPRVQAEAYRQSVLARNEARREGRYVLFANANLDGPEARALYAVLRERKPWIDPTLAVFERRADSPPKDVKPDTDPPRGTGRGPHRHGRPHRRAVCRSRGSSVARARTARRKRIHAGRGDYRRHRHGGCVPVSQRRARRVACRAAGGSGRRRWRRRTGYLGRPSDGARHDRRQMDRYRALSRELTCASRYTASSDTDTAAAISSTSAARSMPVSG